MKLALGIILFLTFCSVKPDSKRVQHTKHFKISYTKLDDLNIKEIADSLGHGYSKITSHLRSGDLPVVNITFYENINDLLKVFPDFPVWAVGQAISMTEIHMISPNNSDHDYQNMIRNVKHEFAHCVSIKINDTIPNNPRWLWESVALYEANFPWDPKMLSYLVGQKPPSINELNDISNQKIYEVGYFISQFLAETYDDKMLNALIKNNGDLKNTLSMDDDEFIKQWFSFMKKKYGI